MYLEPTQATGRAFVQRNLVGPVDMLNLLRFRLVADYTDAPELAPAGPITGREAYRLYAAHTEPFLVASGGELLYSGSGGPALIGPDDEQWDLVMVVRHKDAATFLSFANDPAYLAGIGHRTAALLDSRLIPLRKGRP